MSLILRSIPDIPKNTDWKNWFCETSHYFYTPKLINTYIKIKFCICSFGEIGIPYEVCNLIITLMFHNSYLKTEIDTSGRWSSVFEWLIYWSKNEDQIIKNPLRFDEDLKMIEPEEIKRMTMSNLIPSLAHISPMDTYKNFKVCPISNLTHYSGCFSRNLDYVLGISFENIDVAQIDSCKLYFNDLEYRTPFNFSKEYSITVYTDYPINKKKTFWQCPSMRIIPIYALYFNLISINIVFKGTYNYQTGATPSVLSFVNKTIQPKGVIIEPRTLRYNKGDSRNEFIISDGTIQYVYK